MRNYAGHLAFALAVLALSFPAAGADAKAKSLKIVAFGTSLTARGGWQLPLEAALGDCLKRPVTVKTVAMSGATSDWAVTAVDRVIEEKPDLVLVEFYANDAAIDRLVTIGRSRSNMDRVLSALKQGLPGARVIVMAMNPIFGIRGFIRPFIESYIDAHRQVASGKGFEFFDNRPAWLRLPPTELSAAIPDGSHPLPQAAAATIVPGLMAEIASGGCREERRG